jgi:hypothetical protein
MDKPITFQHVADAIAVGTGLLEVPLPLGGVPNAPAMIIEGDKDA